MRQGNDVGTQYRSIIIPATPEQRRLAEIVTRRLPGAPDRGRLRADQTEINETPEFYYAEDYHQQSRQGPERLLPDRTPPA